MFDRYTIICSLTVHVNKLNTRSITCFLFFLYLEYLPYADFNLCLSAQLCSDGIIKHVEACYSVESCSSRHNQVHKVQAVCCPVKLELNCSCLVF